MLEEYSFATKAVCCWHVHD